MTSSRPTLSQVLPGASLRVLIPRRRIGSRVAELAGQISRAHGGGELTVLIGEDFVVGCGLDFDGLWRNLPDVCLLGDLEAPQA